MMDLVWVWLGRVADVASLVALPASVYAALRIRAIKKRLVDGTRLDPLVKSILDTVEKVESLADDYVTNRVIIESSFKRCLALTYRYQSRLPKDAVARVARLKELETRLDSIHNVQEAISQAAPRLAVIQDLSIELTVIAALVQETLLSRQVGGEDA